jgi:hypothetical protein
MPVAPPRVESVQDLAALISRLSHERDSLIEQFNEAILGLEKFADLAGMLSPALIDRTVLELIQDLPSSVFVGDEVARLPEDAPLPSRYTGTVFDRMVQFFTGHDNEPASNAQIRKAIDSNRGTVAMVLYNTHAKLFDKIKKQDDHIIYWKLTKSFYDDLMRPPPRAKSEVLQPRLAAGDQEDIPF